MRRIGVIAFLIFLTFSLRAQQLPQYSQYDFNKFIINPAVAGSESYIDLLFSHRSQWVGFEGAPRTQTFSGHALMPNETMGVGTYFFKDRVGPATNTGFNLSYAYHIDMNGTFMAFGLSGSYFQHAIDGSEITLTNAVDDAIDKALYKQSVPDAAFGFYMYDAQYHFGLSVQHLIGNKVKAFDPVATGLVPLKRHIYLLGGAVYEAGDYVRLEPSLMAEYVPANPIQVDLRMRMYYMGFFYSGVGYRTGDALIFTLGAFIDEKVLIAYSYDMLLSKLRGTSSGSHEIVVGYNVELNYFRQGGDPRPKKRYKLRLKKK